MYVNTAAFESVPPSVQSAAMEVHHALGKRIPHAIVGGMALGAYVEGARSTSDVDVLVSASHKAKVMDLFPSGHSGFAQHGRFGMWTAMISGVEVDFLFADDLPPDFFDDLSYVNELPVISPRALTALKIRSGREKDTGDIVEILKSQLRQHPKIVEKYIEDLYKPTSKDPDTVRENALNKVFEKIESLKAIRNYFKTHGFHSLDGDDYEEVLKNHLEEALLKSGSKATPSRKPTKADPISEMSERMTANPEWTEDSDLDW